MNLKKCSKCLLNLSTDCFYKNKTWADALHPYCISCLLRYQKSRRERKRDDATGMIPGTRYRWNKDIVNHNYFQEINSSIKAYILGFIAADGNILKKESRITIELSEKDFSLLEMIRDELIPGGIIHKRVRKGFTSIILRFVSSQMVEDLERYNIIPNKTNNLQWPEKLPKYLYCDYILGYFDGDGHITSWTVKDKIYWRVGFSSSSRSFLEHISQNTCNIKGRIYKKSKQCYSLVYNGKEAKKINEWMHQNLAGLCRKHLPKEITMLN